MSAYCNFYSQNCIQQCCDIAGHCPSYSGKPCYHAYFQTSPTNTIIHLPVSTLIGIAVGAVVSLLILFGLSFWWEYKKEKNVTTKGSSAKTKSDIQEGSQLPLSVLKSNVNNNCFYGTPTPAVAQHFQEKAQGKEICEQLPTVRRKGSEFTFRSRKSNIKQ